MGTGLSVLGLGFAFNPLIERILREDHEELRRMSETRTILTACVAFSKDRGRFPPTLDALYPNYIDDESLLNPDPKSGQPYLYRPGLVETDSSREPLIISPPDKDGKRLVGFIGGQVTEESLGVLPPEILEQFKPPR